MDENETGSANFFGPVRRRLSTERTRGNREIPSAHYDPLMHIRPPSIDRGVTSFFWGVGLAAFIFLGLVAVGLSRGTALLLALLSFGAIFLFVRTRGEEL